MIRLVPVLEVDLVWPHICEGMQEACRRGNGNITPWHVYQSCRTGSALLFVAVLEEQITGAIVCEVHERPQGNALKIVALCGRDFHEWRTELKAYEWPGTVQIKKVIWEGRKGFERAIPGARVLRQVYEMDL